MAKTKGGSKKQSTKCHGFLNGINSPFIYLYMCINFIYL